MVGMVIFRDSPLSTRARFFSAPPRLALPFTAHDDYMTIVEKLGRPDSGRSRPAPDGREFFLLGIRTVRSRWCCSARCAKTPGTSERWRGGRVVHSVTLPGGEIVAVILISQIELGATFRRGILSPSRCRH